MFEGYKARIQSYCEEAGIEVPVGFGRHAAGRYVAIDDESSPPKLVATTLAEPKGCGELPGQLGGRPEDADTRLHGSSRAEF